MISALSSKPHVSYYLLIEDSPWCHWSPPLAGGFSCGWNMSLTESSDSWQIHSDVSETYFLEGHRGLEIDSSLMCFGREFVEENFTEESKGSHMWPQMRAKGPAYTSSPWLPLLPLFWTAFGIKCHLWFFTEKLKHCLPLWTEEMPHREWSFRVITFVSTGSCHWIIHLYTLAHFL